MIILQSTYKLIVAMIKLNPVATWESGQFQNVNKVKLLAS